jgi:Zn-dependent M28 family amino/carboxypeptidase
MIFILILVIFSLAGCTAAASGSIPQPTLTNTIGPPTSTPEPLPSQTPTKGFVKAFDGAKAYEHLISQVDLGPRVPESSAHNEAGDLIIQHLSELGWVVEEQIFQVEGIQGRNIIAKANLKGGPIIILGAHYDTRSISDRSPESDRPVPGAVDGASGVAVLLELARTLNFENISQEIWMVFFDLEDQGKGAIPGLDYIEGSAYMASNLEVIPVAVVVVDMVGDIEQQFFYEGYSDPELGQALWSVADDLGYREYFIPQVGRTLRDDHLPFLQKGIPAITIIDIDYPYWHTIEDTVDKTHPDSLDRVGKVLQHWLEKEIRG